jgi:Phosphodiester glycosidase
MAKRFFRTTIRAYVLLALLTPASLALAQAKIGATLTVSDAGSWKSIQKGVEFRKIVLERTEPGYQVELNLLRLDSQYIVPRVLYAGEFQLKSASAKTFTEKAGAIAAINANYFDEKGRPLAYLKTIEKEINRAVSKHRLYTGVFGLGDAGPFVMHRDDFQPAQASQALQSGPLLVHRSAAVDGMDGLTRSARRSVVGLNKNNRILIAVTDALIGGLSFSELQELFSQSKWQLDAVELLNLDGGGSAQLYLKSGKFEEWLPGTSEVPVAIGFFNKAN